MTTSILLRSPSSPSSPSPSPASSPLPRLLADLSSSSSSSSSSTSNSCLDLHRATSSRSRRIRFAPLPDPNRDFSDPSLSPDDPQSPPKTATPQIASPSNDTPDSFIALSPSISPDSTLSSARSTPTIRMSSRNSSNSTLKLLRTLPFIRRSGASSLNSSPLSQSPSMCGSCDSPPVRPSSSVSSPPPTKFSRFSTEDILAGTKSLFRARSGSASAARPSRASSPPPRSSDSTKSHHRSASTGSGPGMSLGNGKRDWVDESSRAQHTPGTDTSSPTKRPSSSGFTPGAGGGRHASSVKMVTDELPPRPSTAPNLSPARPKRHVKMLNGRVYGAKRYAAQTLANPFATAREEPEFVEWGYGGMGSVHASVGIANDIWKGLQRSERGGALLASSSLESTGSVSAGGGRGSGATPTSSIARRKMLDNVPECGMGNVGAGGDEDDGSGLAWVKRRRAEKEAKARLEEAARELEKKTLQGRKRGDSIDASMDASTASTATSLTACTSAASTDLSTPTTSPFASRSPSVSELKLTPSPCLDPRDLGLPQTCTVNDQAFKPDAPLTQIVPASKDEHEHHVAIVLSPNISSPSHDHSHTTTYVRTRNSEGTEQEVPLSPADTEETSASANSFGDDDDDDNEQSRGIDEGDVDDEEEVQDITRKTALGAGVEKVSRHVDVEAR